MYFSELYLFFYEFWKFAAFCICIKIGVHFTGAAKCTRGSSSWVSATGPEATLAFQLSTEGPLPSSLGELARELDTVRWSRRLPEQGGERGHGSGCVRRGEATRTISWRRSYYLVTGDEVVVNGARWRYTVTMGGDKRRWCRRCGSESRGGTGGKGA